MKLSIKDTANKETGVIQAPNQFDEEYRPDLIIRAVLTLQSRARQKYGANPEAGKRASAELSRRRRKYRGSYGFGISRVPRKIHSRRGTRMYWVGAFAPGTVGGRRAHPPKAEKNWEQKINRKENRKAIRSAMAATLEKNLVRARGHKIPDAYPFALDDSFEQLAKTRDVVAALATVGFAEELDRASQKTIRAGKGKLRGRKYKRRKGPLVVVGSEKAKLLKSARNIPGVDIVTVESLNAAYLAPGTHPGRATLYTASALKRLTDEKLFTPDFHGTSAKKERSFVKKNRKQSGKPEKESAAENPAEKPKQEVKKEAKKESLKLAEKESATKETPTKKTTPKAANEVTA